MSSNKLSFIFEGEAPKRIDLVLIEKLTEQGSEQLSRSQVRRLVEAGRVTVNAVGISKASFLVKPGLLVDCLLELPTAEEIEEYDIPLEVLFEDEALLVVNKPSSLTVHPGGGNRSETLLNALVSHVKKSKIIPEDFSPGMPHRLDRDTTGVMVLTKTEFAKTHLSRQFAYRTVERSYLALAFITPRSQRFVQMNDEGKVETQIGRHPHQRTKMAVIKEGSSSANTKNAITNWKVIERFIYGALVECRLETGRTHQIRVHLEHLGSPIVGDQVYGDFTGLPKVLEIDAAKFGRQALHAQQLGFIHPVTGKTLRFKVDPPKDFQQLVQKFRETSRSSQGHT